MKLTLISTSVMLIVWLFLATAAVYLIYLIMKALRKYTKSMPVRKEKDGATKPIVPPSDKNSGYLIYCLLTSSFRFCLNN